ncbi:hypothetical protein EIB71_02880 [Kaistella daneshvariae]|uniref:Uncharacterized protein n=1 Tax=Kaistella daneshvariae TaxID=2487074 RepID=A0ABM7C6X0_9FLAO|nr:hypothetical protein [Kaistella daneshvariae]AZI66690.1 hypothetical protein EIB71_02880 [Kaistella daneshvariae]
MRVKKYFVSKYQKEAGKKNGSSDGDFLAQSGEVGAQGSLILAFSNCNIGISFHDVVQNIFTVFWANFYVLTIGNTKTPFQKIERVENQLLKVGYIIICAKIECKDTFSLRHWQILLI